MSWCNIYCYIMTAYKPREISSFLLKAAESMPVVVLSGMRQTGKSTLLQHLPEFSQRRYLTFDDFNTLEAARRNPESLISGDGPLTIDEAQKFPEILSVIKRQVDRLRRPGQFILSGSANFLLLKNIAETLAGRAVYLTLYPFSRREILGIANEPVLIHFLKTGRFPKREVKSIPWKDVIKGGMPSVCLGQVKEPKIWFQGYEQTYLERDIRSLSQVGDLIAFKNLLHLVSLRNAQILKQSELARDAKLNVMSGDAVAATLIKGNAYEEAVARLQGLKSRTLEDNYNLALAYEASGQFALAIGAYETALTQAPNEASIQEALKRLKK